MKSMISDDILSGLAEFVDTRMGLYFPGERLRDLERGISSAALEFGFEDADSCIRWLLVSPLTKNQIEILASHLTVGETYFFREKKSYEVLDEHILPLLMRSRRGKEQYLRVWSAGCSTGEEPYSIAILLSRMIPDIEDWNITILATDINPHFLRKAQEGVYGEWSFRDAPSWVKKYFKITKNGFRILPDIKKLVTFSYHNLAEDTYPSLLNNTNAMDAIFCRNVLMYFSLERAKHVVQALYRSLADGGWLVVSPVETSHVLFSQYATVNFPDVIFYKKDMSKAQPLIPFSKLPIKSLKEKRELIVDKQKIAQPQPYDEALTLYERGKYAQAAGKIVEIASLFHDTKAMTLLARACANQGKLTEAQEWCEKAIASDRLNPGCHYLRATILQEQGEIEESVSSLKRALYLDQDFVLAHFALGNLSKQLGKLKESDKYFENALMLLRRFGKNDILPGSDGIIAGRLSEIITSMKDRGILDE